MIDQLYKQISQLQEDYETIIINNNGEITEEANLIEAKIIDLLSSEKDNVDNLYYLKLSLESDMEKYLTLKEQIEKLIQKQQKRIDNIRYYIADIMIKNNKDKLVGNLCSIKWRTTTGLKIIDKDVIPQEYKKVSYTIDKTAIKKLIEQGQQIQGTELIKQNTVTFYSRGK